MKKLLYGLLFVSLLAACATPTPQIIVVTATPLPTDTPEPTVTNTPKPTIAPLPTKVLRPATAARQTPFDFAMGDLVAFADENEFFRWADEPCFISSTPEWATCSTYYYYDDAGVSTRAIQALHEDEIVVGIIMAATGADPAEGLAPLIMFFMLPIPLGDFPTVPTKLGAFAVFADFGDPWTTVVYLSPTTAIAMFGWVDTPGGDGIQ